MSPDHEPQEIDVAIAENHRTILAAYSRYMVADDPVDKRHLLLEFVRRIAVDFAAEESVLYPQVCAYDARSAQFLEWICDPFLSIAQIDEADKGLDDHYEIMGKLRKLESSEIRGEAFEGLLSDIMVHVTTQENTILPKLRKSLGAGAQERLRELGEQYKIATSVEHRSQKANANVQLSVGSVAAAWESVREAIEKGKESAQKSRTR
ncbi:hypothetical protein HDU93_008906 [Gonapodya sp. JEL0774]|nr:hypothetical protein HDU93_008906 [Gonapodya sp. JEL0774]